MPADPEIQLTLFRQAVDMLGGQRNTARLLDVTERTVYRLYNGASTLHTGFLRDISTALLRHADACRALERRLSPAFSDNLTPDQPHEDGRRKRDA